MDMEWDAVLQGVCWRKKGVDCDSGSGDEKSWLAVGGCCKVVVFDHQIKHGLLLVDVSVHFFFKSGNVSRDVAVVAQTGSRHGVRIEGLFEGLEGLVVDHHLPKFEGRGGNDRGRTGGGRSVGCWATRSGHGDK